MPALIKKTILVIFAASTCTSALVIDVIQEGAPSTFRRLIGQTSKPILRLCRPAPGSLPFAINPLKNTCEQYNGSPYWQWQYDATPSVYPTGATTGQTVINLLGPSSNTRETPMLLSETSYGSTLTYGFTDTGIRQQPAQFRVKRNMGYQGINSGNPLQPLDELDFYGPTLAPYTDTTLRIETATKPSTLVRQPTNSALSVAKLRIASLDTQSTTLTALPSNNIPSQTWLQRGTNALNRFGNALGNQVLTTYDNYLDPALKSTASWLASNQGNILNAAGQVLLNRGTQLYNTAGTALNNYVDAITPSLAQAGGWVGNTANSLYNGAMALPGQINTAVNTDLGANIPSIATGWNMLRDAGNTGLKWAGNQLAQGWNGAVGAVNGLVAPQQQVQSVGVPVQSVGVPVGVNELNGMVNGLNGVNGVNGVNGLNGVNGNALPVVGGTVDDGDNDVLEAVDPYATVGGQYVQNGAVAVV